MPAIETDYQTCQQILREGSKSFHAAWHLLPRRIHGPVAAVYAFCRIADDAIDSPEPGLAPPLQRLNQRLDALYAGRPQEHPVDRALAHVVQRYQLPKALWLALFEGFLWDTQERSYESLPDVYAYCVRVASTVGLLMTVLMGERRPQVLARACDLGVAMQLTNIARDVGEDARAGRLYLPRMWMREKGIDPEAFLKKPRFSPELGELIARLLQVAQGFYQKADHGIVLLPRDCRIAICAARLIYADIGRVLRAQGCDSVSRRAVTSRGRKLWLLLRALPVVLRPSPEPSLDPALAQAQFLLDALTQWAPGPLLEAKNPW